MNIIVDQAAFEEYAEAVVWQHLGVTAPWNSGPLCPWHNPFKNNGYHVHRDETGHWHVHRPDGTEIHPM